MKKILFGVLLLVVFNAFSFAQKAGKAKPDAAGSATSGAMTGGVGLTWIDGEAYYLINLAPEISFGKIGIGLDLNLHISSKDQKIRKEDFDETYDYFRIIRYLRYGSKGDDIYARLGMLDFAQLGHGSILYQYKNSPSVDARKIGVEFDLDFNKYGFESVYSDFAAAGLLGMRGYVRPLQFTPLADVPVIGGLQAGVTFASDLRSDSRDTSINIVASGATFDTSKTNIGSINIIGFDLGLPLLRIPMVNMTVYYDFAKIINFGSGMSVGLETNFSGLGLVNIFTKFERRFAQTDQYIPSYFDAFYELERYQLGAGKFSSKARLLAATKTPGPGYFGSLTVDVLGIIQAYGQYQRLDNNPTSGILHIGASTGNKIPLISLDAGYDKKYIKDNKDVFTLDDRSLLYAQVGYKPYPFMIVATVYTWTFAPVDDGNGNISYKPQKRITPKVSFVFPL
ncbi:MAG: hypothetical protein H3C35_07535 [Bacteroidetes bacterium]|nr:hypothetical protein [Bacteroidota bacterium]